MRIAVFSYLMLLYVPAFSEETRDVPVESIWGYGLPGTRDVYELEPDFEPKEHSTQECYRISRVWRLSTHLNQWKQSHPVFAVPGQDLDALNNAHRVIVEKKPPLPVRADRPFSLVFFTGPIGGKAEIKSVALPGTSSDAVRIVCELTGTAEMVQRVHFALIPMDPVSAANLRVEVVVKDAPVAPEILAGVVSDISKQRVGSSTILTLDFSED